eukprot:scaffold17661_cov17-Tisochrysis_lutea.AAC.1
MTNIPYSHKWTLPKTASDSSCICRDAPGIHDDLAALFRWLRLTLRGGPSGVTWSFTLCRIQGFKVKTPVPAIVRQGKQEDAGLQWRVFTKCTDDAKLLKVPRLGQCYRCAFVTLSVSTSHNNGGVLSVNETTGRLYVP